MRKLIAGLAALALGGITVAHAQEVPSDDLMDQVKQEQATQQAGEVEVMDPDTAAPIVLAQRSARSGRGARSGRSARGGRSASRSASPRRSAGRSASRRSASRGRAAPRRAARSRAAPSRSARGRATPGRAARSRAQPNRAARSRQTPGRAERRGGTRTGEARRDRAAQERRAARGDRRARVERPDRPRERAGRGARDGDGARRDGRRAALIRDGRRPVGERRRPARGVEDAKRVDLRGDRDRRDRVRKAFRDKYDRRHRRDVRRYRGVGFAIAVGTILPAYWYYAPVPYEVVEVVPEYDGYAYAYVDDQYVIAHPETREVVGVMPAPEGPPAREIADADTCKAAGLDLDEEQRAHILRSIAVADEVDVSGLTIGWAVPRDITLQTFPEPVVERIGELDHCRYFVADDQIAIVDPEEEAVVLLIDQKS